MKWFRKLRAKLNKTFDAECPRCHQRYYGHQGHKEQVKAKNHEGKVIHYRYLCYKCMKDEYKAM